MSARLLLGAALVPVALVAGPAAADAPEHTYTLSVSADGEHWGSESASIVLGGRERVWLPGEHRSARFFVRNDSPRPADLAVRLRPGAPGGLVAAGDVTFRSRTGRGGWSGAEGDTLARVPGLAPGTAVPVVVEAALAASARPRAEQSEALVLDVDLRGRTGALQPAATPALPLRWQSWAAAGAVLVRAVGTLGTVLGRRRHP